MTSMPRHWPKGIPRTLRVPRATLPDYLETTADRYPDKPAIVFRSLETRYAQLRDRVHRLGAYLQQRLDVRHGDRVLLLSQNCPQFVTAYYAALRIGAVVVPVNPMSKAGEIRHYLADSGARVAVMAHELLPALELGDMPGQARAAVAFRYDDSDEAVAQGSADSDPRVHAFEQAIAQALQMMPVDVRPADLAVLPYTSGTTGHPKGCRHTHETMIAALAGSAVWKQLHVDTVALAVAPLFHMLGMQNGMNLPIYLGATAVVMGRWDASEAARLIETHRVSAWSAPPTMVNDLFSLPGIEQRDLTSLALLAGGGAAMPEALAAAIGSRYGLAYSESYGLTESASFLLANPLSHGKRQCLGIATQGVDARIVEPGRTREVPEGEVGELITHGPQIMRGYWNDAAADGESFADIDGKRFFRTGDLVSRDADGYIFMRDRIKRMINASGFKVWPSEVESIMYAHPAVLDACVISAPDRRRGETVKALVVLKPGCRDQVTAQAFIEWCRGQMAVYKAPRLVEFVDTLPRSSAGKILWRSLQDDEWRAASDDAAGHPASPV